MCKVKRRELANILQFVILRSELQMTEWARVTWNFMHTQSFYIDLYEHHGLASQKAFVNFLLSLPSQLPCSECRPHLAAFFRSDPPPNPVAYEPEDYVYAKYIWRLHNSVNRRLQKPEPTFAAVVDHYVNGRQDVACSTTVNASVGASASASASGQASGQASSQAFQPASTPQQQQQQQNTSAQQTTSTTCGIPDYAVPAVVCVALAILFVIVLCAVLDVRRSKARSNALN